MTVCAAAICESQSPADGGKRLLAIADRMLTWGDIEYEGLDRPKLLTFEPPATVVCMGSGDAASHDAVFSQTRAQVSRDNVTRVAEIADLYAENFAAYRRGRAERLFLHPRGLDLGTFTACQQTMNPTLAVEIDRLLMEADLGIEAIVCGFDTEGPHIFSVRDPGVATCHDSIGFYAIGSGATQFGALFMYSGYSPFWNWFDALFLMYAAKKRAEVSPGVGKDTDMYSMKSNKSGRERGNGFLTPECLNALDRYYAEFVDKTDRSRREIGDRMTADANFVKPPNADG